MSRSRYQLAAAVLTLCVSFSPTVRSADAQDAGTRADTAAPATPMTPQAHAEAIASTNPMVKRALHQIRLAAAELKDPQLRSAVELQIQAPWLPRDAFAWSHPAEAEAMLHAAGLLAADAHLTIPPVGSGSLASAPGGPCVTGHHGYPGGLAVHESVNMQHARALATIYKETYGVHLNEEWLVAAALWHDTLKAGTLPWDASGDCPHTEPLLAGTALHHPLGVAAAILRHLPAPLVMVIASAHTPPWGDHFGEVCNYLRAAGIVAVGDEHRIACLSADPRSPRPPIEAFVNHFSDADFPLTVSTWSWYASQTPSGWERFSALETDGSDVAAFERAGIPR